MAKLVSFDSNGRILYNGLLSSAEVKEFNKVKDSLINEIPLIEKDLKEKFADRIEYKYYLGKYFQEALEKFEVSARERRQFWDEIKNLATTENRKRADGQSSKQRCFFEQCFRLSLLDIAIVKKLSWRQWQSLFDRDNKLVEDGRFFEWIGSKEEKIKEIEWRELLKIMNFYLEESDTSIFSKEELYCLYDSILLMTQTWIEGIQKFAKEHPKSLKLQSKVKWSIKYYKECFNCPNKCLEEFELVFENLMSK